jgi:fructose-bisphosphate aldolase, class I
MNGTHSIERSYEVTRETLHEVFRELHRQRVALEGMLLKTNMVVTGYDADQRASVDEVAERTLRCLCQTVPAAVPGIVFLSGGQNDFASSAHLNAMSKVKGLPWVISFSYARALQGLTITTWAGQEGNARDAQAAFHYRAGSPPPPTPVGGPRTWNASPRRCYPRPSGNSKPRLPDGGTVRELLKRGGA